MREFVIGLERTERDGPMLLAVTHLSHLEPMIVGTRVARPIRWMARLEFYQRRWSAAMLRGGGAFPVDRFGWSLPAVRTAERLLRQGQAVGMFPEGGVAKGRASVLRGGPIKGGVCTIAIQTQTPIIPVVVLGTHELNRVGPWLPFKRARCWTAFGEPVAPPSRSGASRRTLRQEMTTRLGEAFGSTFHELRTQAGLPLDIIPDEQPSDDIHFATLQERATRANSHEAANHQGTLGLLGGCDVNSHPSPPAIQPHAGASR